MFSYEPHNVMREVSHCNLYTRDSKVYLKCQHGNLCLLLVLVRDWIIRLLFFTEETVNGFVYQNVLEL
jgi:hypothetical protein